MDLLDHVLGLAPPAGGLRPGASILAAVSGGRDSMVLLDLLARAAGRRDLRVEVGHLDHGLRPDSAEDAALVADRARRHGLRFHTTQLDPEDLDLDLGPEAAARAARYAWLESIRTARGLDAIATAHHRDDHAETLLLALGRGTGLAGMRGIAPARGTLIRPLRDVHPRDLDAYARAHAVGFRADPTNQSPRFRRNRVRHELLPLFDDIFGGDTAGRIVGFAGRLDRDREALAAAVDLARQACGVQRQAARLTVDRQAWRTLHKSLQFHVLRGMLREIQAETGPQRWNEAAYLRVLDFVDTGRAGATMPLPGGGSLVLARGHWVLAGGPPETAEFVLLEEVLPALGDVVTLPQSRCAWFDAERVRSPIVLRSAEPGDRIQPPGMIGHRKLTALFRERDIPVDQRSSMMVVEDTERIIWAVGITTAHETRPTAHTERFLRLTVEPRSRGADRRPASDPPSGP